MNGERLKNTVNNFSRENYVDLEFQPGCLISKHNNSEWSSVEIAVLVEASVVMVSFVVVAELVMVSSSAVMEVVVR